MKPFARCLIILLGAICSLQAQTTPESESITLQGKGDTKTRSFTVQDNWTVQVTSDAAVKVSSVAGDTSTVLVGLPPATPPPPVYTATSAPVQKGGTYLLSIETTGTWQATIVESGFKKDLVIGGAPATPPATAAATSASAAAPVAAAAPAPPGLPPGSPVPPMGPSYGGYRPTYRPLASFVRKDQPDLNSAEKTDRFTAQGRWAVRWTSEQGVSIKLCPDNQPIITLVAETGSIPMTPQYSYTVPRTQQYAPNGQGGFSSVPQQPSEPREIGPLLHRGSCMGAGPGTFRFLVEGAGNWTLSAYEMGESSSGYPGMPPTMAGTAAAPAVPAAPAPTVKLTEDQARAVVLIKGDKAQGTGFMIKTPNGPAVITNIHVIANNPNLKVTTNTGALVEVLSEKGASDRDLAMLTIKDNGYSYMEFATDISKNVQPGDEVVTPGNSQGGEVMLNTGGKVLGIGPVRIEFDNPIYHGNSGGPVFHTKSSKVLGVVTEAVKVDTSDSVAKASFASRNSAITGTMRYFGLRLDTVSAWIPIDAKRFQVETTFLDEFHEQSRRLDAYMNHDENDRDAAARVYHSDDKIMKANDRYADRVSGSDTAQHIDLVRSLIFDLQCIADFNLDQISNKGNFYPFDQDRAQDELDYRKALKKELDSISNDVQRASFLPRSNN